jgi:rare lipoprotein A
LKKVTFVAIALSLIVFFSNSSYAGFSGYTHPYGGVLIRASYYCSGSRTASGEHFNPNGFTAAHRTLPFGTRLAVTNPANGRTVVVRINDRGPFVRGVSLDLARGAAFAIGMRGNATVRIAEVGGEAEGLTDAYSQDAFAREPSSRGQTAWSQEAPGPKDATRFWGSPFERAFD